MKTYWLKKVDIIRNVLVEKCDEKESVGRGL